MSKIHTKTGKSCLICTDETIDGLILHKSRRQTHAMCGDCAKGYLNPIIKRLTDNLRKNIRHKINILKCPGSYRGEQRNLCRCEVDITKLDINPKWDMYTDIFRIKFTLESNNRYVCPERKCGNIVETHPQDDNNRIDCSECKTNWCKVCLSQPYHIGMSCIENESKENKTENGKYIWSLRTSGKLKFCPRCRAATLKNGGCNKMICESCDLKWCWLCNSQDIDYDHYNANSGTNCGDRLWEE